MYRNSYKIFSLIICLLIFILPLSAKPKDSEQESNVYYKYNHPRDYIFDLCDAKDKVVLKFDNSIGKLSCNVDFTHLVKEEMPRKGDRITFKYQFVPSKNVKNITAFVFDIKKGKNLGNKNPELFSKPTPKKTVCSKEFSIILNDDADLSLVLCLQSATEDTKDKVELSFNRILESTNIKNELAEEKKAIKKGYKIVPVTMDFAVKTDDDDDVTTENQESILETEEQNLQKIEQEESEIQENTEIQKEVESQEEQKIEENINDTINDNVEESTTEIKSVEKTEIKTEEIEIKEESKVEVIPEVVEKNESPIETEQKTELPAIEIDTTIEVQRYQKEYLQDYVVNDEIIIDIPVIEQEDLIENPDEQDLNGVTKLMTAAKAGNDWEIKLLIDSKASMNIKDNDGWTALMYAARYQESISCIELLLNAGADVKLKNNYDSTALILAASYNNNPEILKKLLSYYSTSEKEITKAFVLLLSENHSSEYSQIAKINAFIGESIPLNSFYNGKTPLMYAAQYASSTKILKILLDNNAITTLRSTDGKTAFDYAKENINLKHDSIYWSLNKQ